MKEACQPERITALKAELAAELVETYSDDDEFSDTNDKEFAQ
jgi:hypothetical protein